MDQSRFLRHFLPAQRAIRAYLQAATRDVHETDDLLQEVSHVLWEKFDQYDEDRPFAAWAMGMARLQAMKWRQAKARGRRMLSDAALVELAAAAARGAGEEDARAGFLARCLDSLQTRARRILEMKYEGGLAIKQIADRLGMQVGAVEMALVRARRALRDCIERKLHASEPEAPARGTEASSR